MDRFKETSTEVIKKSSENEMEKAQELYKTNVVPLSMQVSESLEDLVKYYIDIAHSEIYRGKGIIKEIAITLIIALVTIIGITILVIFNITKAIRTPVFQIKEVLDKMGKRDFTSDIKYQSKSELGIIAQSLRDTTSNMRELLGNIKSISQVLASSAEELTSVQSR